MCQIGAFGMAIRGHSYQDILQHYYTGIDIVRTAP
jgi:SpoIID/LytB domain protein